MFIGRSTLASWLRRQPVHHWYKTSSIYFICHHILNSISLLLLKFITGKKRINGQLRTNYVLKISPPQLGWSSPTDFEPQHLNELTQDLNGEVGWQRNWKGAEYFNNELSSSYGPPPPPMPDLRLWYETQDWNILFRFDGQDVQEIFFSKHFIDTMNINV